MMFLSNVSNQGVCTYVRYVLFVVVYIHARVCGQAYKRVLITLAHFNACMQRCVGKENGVLLCVNFLIVNF